MKLKYIIKEFEWLKILNSPFKPFSIKWYIGKTQIGVPYFLPRKWVKGTPKLAHKATLEYIAKEESYNRLNPNHARKIKSYDEIYREKLRYNYPVPLKVGFSYCGLGWKTKWKDTDFRYEWGPVFSFVFFGYQIAMMVGFRNKNAIDAYWEAWLCYEKATDKSKSKQERVDECRKIMPQRWTRYSEGKEETIDYYESILKTKYLKNK